MAHDALQHGLPTMPLKLKHIFPGERTRCIEEQGDTLINWMKFGIKDSQQGCKTCFGNFAAKMLAKKNRAHVTCTSE